MSYIEITNPAYGFMDPAALRSKGAELREAYAAAEPFPHVVIDDFLSPEALDACLEDFPRAPDPESLSFDRDQERYKTSYNPDYLPARSRSLFYSLNSRPFLDFLQNMTGIKGLIADPFFLGGGFHETRQGGHLSVHADFNLHGSLKVERRLNLLVYLNRGWRAEYGGALELWDRGMERCVRKIEPLFNRGVVFSTDATSFHGHPDPVAHPEGRSRRSLALYYYTATFDDGARPYSTQFKTRRNTGDKIDWKVKSDEVLEEILPPIVLRNFRRAMRRLRA